MSELRHKSCKGRVKKTPDKFLSEKLKNEGLTHYCFCCMVPIKPAEVEEKEEEGK